jgi:hypothetical protein
MKILRTDAFKEDYKRLPKNVQAKFDQKIRYFKTDFRHPCLSIPKYLLAQPANIKAFNQL